MEQEPGEMDSSATREGLAVLPPRVQVPAGSWGGSWFGEGGPGSEWQGNQEPPQFEPPAGCDSHCWGYQPCNVGFTHPSYEGWDHTKPEPPNCSRASAGAPLANGEGCCHTTAYMAILDEVYVPKVPPGDYVVRWRWVRRNRHSLVLRALLFASSDAPLRTGLRTVAADLERLRRHHHRVK